ncbi:hypothetical protein BMR99_10260 [Propionibacterium freudenreichii]|nr:hypothetical protein [Yaniella sp.]ARO11236.1 hypothetical protein BMR99_00580 [Propionibacterium freudenreichii]ARO12739.1 hypothetical protein BMR99_09825 [Propionibacterium freudenreichii]ARO12798.1 hypothetical protein BMR99_10260 [Propionibacterium freudenreichii]MCT2976049.1 hypothetical protein [Propionibacterium freudenreichii]MCT2981308.1 hypothetical protein [Propionibacterium freudenreichii]
MSRSSPQGETNVVPVNDQAVSSQPTVFRRVMFGVAILLCDLLSAALSYWPLVMIGLVLMQVKANVIGPAEHIVGAGEDSLAFMVFYVVSAIVVLMLAVLPAVIGNLALRRRAGWPPRVCVAVAAAVILAPAVAAVVAPLTMNEIWYRATHWW